MFLWMKLSKRISILRMISPFVLNSKNKNIKGGGSSQYQEHG